MVAKGAFKVGATWLALALLTSCAVDVPAKSEFGLARCTTVVDVAADGDPLDLVAILPLTDVNGEDNAASVARARAIELAVTEANDRQGVKSRTFRLRVCDSGGKTADPAAVAREIATRVVTVDKPPFALLTGGTAETLAVHAGTRKHGTLVLSVSATSPDLTGFDDDDLLWRVAPSDRLQGLVMSHLLGESGAKSVVVLAENGSYGDGLSNVIDAHPPAGADVSVVTYKSDPEAITKALAFAEKKQPDHVVLIGSTSSGAQLLNGFSTHPHLSKSKLLLSDFMKRTGVFAQLDNPKQLVGAMGTTPGDPPDAVFTKFKDRFEQLVGADATQQSFTAHAYDAAWCLVLAHAWALRNDAKDTLSGEGLADGLGQLSLPTGATVTFESTLFAVGISDLLAGKPVNVHGASGDLDFDATAGEPTSAVEVWRVTEGQAFEALYWLDAKSKTDKVPELVKIFPKK